MIETKCPWFSFGAPSPRFLSLVFYDISDWFQNRGFQNGFDLKLGFGPNGPRSTVTYLAFAEHAQRQVRQRRQIARSADGALFGNPGQARTVEGGDDLLGPDPTRTNSAWSAETGAWAETVTGLRWFLIEKENLYLEPQPQVLSHFFGGGDFLIVFNDNRLSINQLNWMRLVRCHKGISLWDVEGAWCIKWEGPTNAIPFYLPLLLFVLFVFFASSLCVWPGPACAGWCRCGPWPKRWCAAPAACGRARAAAACRRRPNANGSGSPAAPAAFRARWRCARTCRNRSWCRTPPGSLSGWRRPDCGRPPPALRPPALRQTMVHIAKSKNGPRKSSRK